jgi:hypothetical protein
MNNIAARMNFENARRALIKANIKEDPNFDVRKYKLTQSYLRLEQLCTVGITNYTFKVLSNEANPTIFNTERRLNLQDSFIPSEVGFFLEFPSSSTDDTFKPLPYPNTFLIGANTAQYFRAYNGELEIRVNQNVLVPYWDMWRHYDVTTTQQTAAIAAGSPSDEFYGENTGFYPMEPNVALIGSKGIQITLTLKNGMTAVNANSRFCLWFRGILAQNSTVVS